ncbi:MAG TPA: PEGA domain-containing protein, partial [Myxococcaceae bacterium]
MSLHRLAVLALVTVLAAPQAFAQDDDLLVPMEPAKPASKSKPKVTKKRPAKKPSTSKKPTPAPAAPEDELVVPMAPVTKTELLVKLLGGVKGARLYVDNKDVGALPGAAVAVEPGEHTIIVRRPGFAEFSRRINVDEGKTQEVSVALDAVAGVVSVTADVPNAKVTINGQPRGQAPLTGIELKPGSHE